MCQGLSPGDMPTSFVAQCGWGLKGTGLKARIPHTLGSTVLPRLLSGVSVITESQVPSSLPQAKEGLSLARSIGESHSPGSRTVAVFRLPCMSGISHSTLRPSAPGSWRRGIRLPPV